MKTLRHTKSYSVSSVVTLLCYFVALHYYPSTRLCATTPTKNLVSFCFVDALLVLASSAATGTTTAAASSNSHFQQQKHVLVTGASGRTGQLVFGALLDDPRFEPKALVRSAKSAKKLMKQVPKTRLDQIIISDVTTLSSSSASSYPYTTNEVEKLNKDSTKPLPPGLEGLDSMVICTSAVPTISKMSLVKALLKAPINMIRGKKAVDFRQLRFVWKYKQYPEIVDYYGHISQIDLAKQLNMKEIILVGSMGGTDPSNFLNSVGKNPDGTGNGDILLWKRKAEQYLIDSDIDYVIIHPGGLIDTPSGQEDYILDVNDKLLNNKKRSISRADVANLCVAALALDPTEYKAINCYPTNHNKATATAATYTATTSNNNVINPNSIIQTLLESVSESNTSNNNNGDKQHEQHKSRKQISLDCVTNLPADGSKIRTAEEALKDFLSKDELTILYDYSM